ISACASRSRRRTVFAATSALGRLVSRRGTDSMIRPRFSYEGSGRGAFVLALVAFASAGASCTRSNVAQGDARDASVTFQSAVVTRPANWQNLWGSWPFNRYYHSMVYDS